MKRLFNFALLFVILVSFGLASTNPAWGSVLNLPDTADPDWAEGVTPGWPLPDRPVPHHDPGHLSRASSYTTQVLQENEVGVQALVEISGVDAMAADGLDPLVGNYSLVNLDKIMMSWNSSDQQSAQTFTSTLEVIPGSQTTFDNYRSMDIAAGDLNNDGQSEQIVAWMDPVDNHIRMSIGEMPGTLGRTTSAPAAIAREGVSPEGYSLEFDGVDDYVTAESGINLSGSSFTVAFWAKRESATDDIVVGQGTSDTNMGLHIGFRNNGKFTCAFWANDLDTPVYENTGWHHWACTYDADTKLRTVYRDGVQVAQDSGVVPYQGSGTLNIGRVPWGSETYFDGLIDEVGIWNVARTRDRIQADMIRLASDDVGLLAYWHFDEGSGTTTADASGNGHTGTLNGPLWNAENAPLGELHLLVRGYDEALWHCVYDLESGGCLSWDNSAGGTLLSAPAVASLVAGQFDTFMIGTDGTDYKIYQRHWDGGWSGNWQQYTDWPYEVPSWTGATPELPPLAVVARDGGFDLFCRGPDNTLFWYDGTNWESLGGALTSGPDAVSLAEEHMQVFARGFDGALWYLTYSGGSWGDWQWLSLDGMDVGVTIASDPTVVSPDSGQMDVYVRGSDDQLWQITYNGTSWDTWQSLGGTLTSRVAVAGGHVFTQMEDGSLQQWDGAVWSSLGGLNPCCTVYDTGLVGVLKDVYPYEDFSLDVETGYFLGDGKSQIVVAYQEPSGMTKIALYQALGGFLPEPIEPTADVTIPHDIDWFRITTGDFLYGDGIDDVALAYVDDQSYGVDIVRLSPEDSKVEIQGVPETDNTTCEWGNKMWFAGTLEVVSGDFDADGQDEVAMTVLLSCDDWTKLPGCETYRYSARTRIFDVVDSDQLNTYYVEDVWQGEARRNTNAWSVGLSITAGDVDGDGKDELIRTWPVGFVMGNWDSCWPYYDFYFNNRFQRKFQIIRLPTGNWSGSEDELESTILYEWEPEGLATWVSYLDRLAAGDLDRDLKAEPAWYGPVSLTDWLSTFDCVVPGEGDLDCDMVSVEFPGQISYPNMVTGGFTGEGIRVGSPSYRFQRSTGDIIALINQPPKHIDILDGVTYDLNSTDTSTYAAYETQTSQSTEMSLQVQRDYGLSAGLETVIGNPTGTHIRSSIDATYGAHFENTTTSFNEIIFGAEVKAINDDIVKYTGKDLRIWEYPIYDDNSGVSTDSLIVAFPEPTASNTGTREFIESGNSTCDFWYAPEHQVNNVWSYAGNISQLKDYDETKGILNNGVAYTIGVNDINNACTTWTDATVSQAASSINMGVSTLFEAQIGGDKITVSASPFGVGVSFDLFLPSVKGTLQSSFSKSALSTHTMAGSDTTSICTFFSSIDPSGIYNYEVTPYLYWAQGGYLVLDYTTKPTNTTFWNRYNKPDPAFILPWTDGHCAGKDQFSKDIVINPPFAGNGETVVITATLHNFSDEPVQDVPVRFCLGDPGAGCVQIGNDQSPDQSVDLPARGKVDVAVSWQASGTGEQRIYALIDPRNEITEMHDETTNPEKNNNIAFGVFSMGDSGYLDPGGAVYFDYQTITYTNTQGIPVIVYLPAASLDEDETARFEMVPLPNFDLGFELTAYQAGSGRDQPWTDLTFDPVPAVVWLRYSESDVSIMAEGSLVLYTYDEDGGAWVDAACGEYLRYPQENQIIVPICQTGMFVLSDQQPEIQRDIYLPMVIR